MSKQDFKLPVTRRDFLKTSSACSLAAAAGGVTIPFTVQASTAAQKGAAAGSAKAVGDKVVWNACKVNCGGRCALRFQLRGNGCAQTTACARYQSDFVF